MPMMPTLIEAVAGRSKAHAVAADLGVEHWAAEHSSRAFGLNRRFTTTVLANVLAFWNRDRLGIELKPGMDEVALALVADAWSRTYRSHADTFAAASNAVASRNGLHILPDRVSREWAPQQTVTAEEDLRPWPALNRALDGIAARYGTRHAAANTGR